MSVALVYAQNFDLMPTTGPTGPFVNLFVIDLENESVLELDGTPGSHLEPGGGVIGEFVAPGQLSTPLDLTFNPTNGHLLVVQQETGPLCLNSMRSETP